MGPQWRGAKQGAFSQKGFWARNCGIDKNFSEKNRGGMGTPKGRVFFGGVSKYSYCGGGTTK